MAYIPGKTLQYHMNRLAGTLNSFDVPTLAAQGAAQVWVGSLSSTEILNSNLATGTDTSANNTGIGVYNGTAPNTYTTATSTDYAQSGNRSIKLASDVGSTSITSMATGSVAISSIYLPAVKPNTKYFLSFYARTAIPITLNTVSLVVVPQEVAGTSLTAVTLASTTDVSNTGWTQITGEFTTSSNHNYLVLRALVTGINLIGQNYYFDTFSMKELAPSTLSLVGSLNYKAGTSGLALQGVLNSLAGTSGLGENEASARIP